MARTKKKLNRENEGLHASLTCRPPTYFWVLRNGLFLGVGAAMAMVLYTVYWFYIATNLKTGVSNWVNERTKQGIHASYKKIEISGFPGDFRVRLRQPKMRTAELTSDNRGDRWNWSATTAVAAMTPWNFAKFKIDLSGNHQFSLASETGRRNYTGSAKKMIIHAVLGSDGLPREATLNIEGLDLTDGQTRAKIATKSAVITVRHLSSGKDTGSDVSLKDKEKSPSFAAEAMFADVRIPKYMNLPLGHRISQLVTELKIIGSVPELKTLEDLQQWRDDGGTVEFDILETKYGPLHMRANGTLALDEAMQPMGAITAKIKGFFATIDALRGARLIRSSDAAMAKMVLGALSKRSPGGGQPTISLPLSVQNSQLQAGLVSMMKIPPIDWPALGLAPARREQFKILR